MENFYKKSRSAFTQIELIFIILIIGILAAMALPKLAATRDDAKLSSDISNVNICIKDAYSKYAATGFILAIADSRACSAVRCYSITPSTTSYIVIADPIGANYCSDIDNVGGHLAKTYVFKGTSVTR